MSPTTRLGTGSLVRTLGPSVLVACVVGAAGCSGLGIQTEPTLAGEVMNEAASEAAVENDLGGSSAYPGTDGIDITPSRHEDRSQGGDLWMETTDGSGWNGDGDGKNDRRAPRIEQLMDVLIAE